MSDLKRQMTPFLARHKTGKANSYIIGFDWHTRAETDEPRSAIEGALYQLEAEDSNDSVAITALFAALHDLDGALRDLRALRLDMAIIAGDSNLTSRFRRS
jgi:hypothetical protein